MSTTATHGVTRTGRLAPPAAPTARPRRRLSGDRATVVGRSDRPVLRIVADDEQAPVFTRVLPSLEPCSSVELFPSVESSPSFELLSSVELCPSVEPVETTRVDLDDFFAPEYDGDDVRLEVAAPRRSTVRLTHRGRVTVVGLGLAVAAGLGLMGAQQALAGGQPEPTRVVTVEPGQTLWDIASASTPAGGDVRSTMAHLESLNHLDSAGLQVGQRLRVPR